MRTEVWRTGQGLKAVVLVRDDETVVVSVDVLHTMFNEMGWRQTEDGADTE